jgi:hypothetical protein
LAGAAGKTEKQQQNERKTHIHHGYPPVKSCSDSLRLHGPLLPNHIWRLFI